MGNVFQYNTATTKTLSCEKDADCYVASSALSIAAATTTAEKAKRCCMHLGFRKYPAGTQAQITNGSLSAASMSVHYGMPATAGYYTLICNLDYPATLPITGLTAVSGTTWANNILQYPVDLGSWQSKQFCAGASSLAAGASVVAAAMSAVY